MLVDAQPPMPRVTVEKLTKRFGSVAAVDDVSFNVPDGLLLTLLGPSGCGKTTTLRALAGLERPDLGRIAVGGDIFFSSEEGINVPAEKRGIGMVFQSYAIWPHMSVFGNVAFALQMRKTPSAEIREKVRKALELVRLAGLEDRPAPHLSGGQQQRVALARALVFDPKILLLDEPLSNLDAKLREHMRAELKELHRRLKMTTIYVTHDQLEALAISDQLAVMNNGRIVERGTPKEIYERPLNPFTADFIGRTNFIQGRLVGREPRSGYCQIDTQPGMLYCQGSEDLKDGQTLLVGIKPENILLVNDTSGNKINQVRGRVVTMQFLGAHIELLVSLGDQTVQVEGHPSAGVPEPGSEVVLELPPEQCIAIRAP